MIVKLPKGWNTLLLLSLPLLMLGCSSTPPADSDTQPATEPQGRELTEIEQLLLQAETAAPLARAQYTLAAAERLLQLQQPLAATDLLLQVNPMILPERAQAWLWLLHAETASQHQRPQRSLDWLDKILDPGTLSQPHQQRYTQLRSAGLGQLGDNLKTLQALILEAESATQAQQAPLSVAIWRRLRQLDASQLSELLARNNSYQQQGWYELAQLTQRTDLDILQLGDALANWHRLWELHPAASNPPAELRQLRSGAPGHIGILLPQSGELQRHARAIIDGFMLSHYRQLQQGLPVPQISFFDSNTLVDLQQFYLEAEQRGIELIIGPLDKDKLRQLTQQPGLAIPTLALNSVDTSTSTINLYQFGLRNEDEAIQSADRAWADGQRVALSLTPATTWGDRIRDSFAQRWRSLGGVIAASERFTGEKDFSDKISQLVATDSSEARAKQLALTLGQRLEFEPRRRQDLDMLFLSALNEDARQIKPTLAYHYASHLPVYATSHLFDGKLDPATYQDLDQIRFNAMPWVLEADNPLRATLAHYRDDSRSRFGRLYALGADSYRLAPYLLQLKALPEAHLQGQSGQLSINYLGQVSRHQTWMQISNGAMHPLTP
ncbi:MAG: outer membrane PBP1 activator LpoA protein [Motiliproteus sp.]|jgi:outer membrane PBP1 activator LpoA protein